MNTPSLPASLCILLLAASGARAQSLEPVGEALVVVNLVTAEYNRDTRSLQVSDRVHQDETIEVGLDASSEIKLDDDTKLALGAGSRLTLDKFVYDPKKANGSIVLDLMKGAFRFMTGVAAKPTYVIKTPAASITVRGTIFDVYVEDNGQSWLLLIEGAIQACNARGQCQTLDEPGKLIRITGDGDVGKPVRWASLQDKGDVPFDNTFPFVVKAPSIDPTPILTRDVIIGTYSDDKNDKDVEKPKGKRDTAKPPKKKREQSTEKKQKTKKKRTAKNSDDDSNIVSGMDIVIGIGGGIGRGGHKHDRGGMGNYGGRSMKGR